MKKQNKKPLSSYCVNIYKGKYRVKIEDAYIEYGNGEEYTVERLAHFLEPEEIKSQKWLKKWAEDFLNEYVKTYETTK